MKRKWKFGLLCTAALLFTLTAGCGKTTEDNKTPLEQFESRMENMQSYSCHATMTRVSNKGQNQYETKQYYKSTGEYKMELLAPESVAGNYTVFDGKQICQFNPRVSGHVILDVPEDKQRNELFLGAFFSNYKENPKSAEEDNALIFETVIPGGNRYAASEKLWVDKASLLPTKLVIYDQDGKERYLIDYQEFTFDASFAPDFFAIPK